MTESAETKGDAWAVSIEVDGRQKYLFETDKLQEMVGASAIMRGMADYARTIEKENENREVGDIHLFQPVSGEVRAWSTERDELLHFAWRLREWLTDRGVEHTAVLLNCRADHFTTDKTDEQARCAAKRKESVRSDVDPVENQPHWPDLAWVHRSLSVLARRVKDAKPGSDSGPTCSLFEACRIHGFDHANEWSPDEETLEGRERRRALRGYRARAKFEARQKDGTRRIDEEIRPSLYTRANTLLPANESESSTDPEGLRKWSQARLASDAERPITIGDLVDPSEWLDHEDAGDQFVAFICADGDGMGRLFTGLDWNLPTWGDPNRDAPEFGALPPWKRNRQFSDALDGAVREAFRAAVAEVTLPDLEALKELHKANEEGNRLTIPVLPQLLGGDDLWTIARRDVALRLCRAFAQAVPQHIEASKILAKGITLSGQALDESDQIGGEPDQTGGEPERTSDKPGQANREPVTLSMSHGIAFAKAGHPVHAMVEAAESLLNSAKELRKGHAWMRAPAGEGCVDWHWIESSLSETVAEARARGTAYTAPDTGDVMLLTTRPWTLSEAAAFERAAELLRGVPRRKREQLEDILRRGHVLSLVAWEAWWKRLRKCEQKAAEAASDALPDDWRLPCPKDDAERAGCEAARWGAHLPRSPWIDVEANGAQQQCNGKQEPATVGQGGQNAKRPPRYYVTPLLDLLALDHLMPRDEGRQKNREENDPFDDTTTSTTPAGEEATGDVDA